jgi:hypothetical protein
MSDKFNDLSKKEDNVQMNINLSDLEDVYCLSCAELYPEGELQNIFHQAFILKRLNPLQSPDGKARVIPLPIFICTKCGNMIDLETWHNKFNK